MGAQIVVGMVAILIIYLIISGKRGLDNKINSYKEERYKDDPKVLKKSGYHHVKRGEIDTALLKFMAAYNMDPNDLELAYIASYNFLLEEDYINSEKIMKNIEYSYQDDKLLLKIINNADYEIFLIEVIASVIYYHGYFFYKKGVVKTADLYKSLAKERDYNVIKLNLY